MKAIHDMQAQRDSIPHQNHPRQNHQSPEGVACRYHRNPITYTQIYYLH